MSQNRYFSSTAAATSLNGGINNSVTTLVVNSATGFPASTPFTLILERDTANEEIVTVTAVSGTTLTVTRGQDGTTAVAHSTGAPVEHGVSARDFNEPQAHIAASSAVHGVTGSVVGTSDTQTLSNKTLTAPTVSSFANANHDHSGSAGGGKLAQANTHQSPDTDAATTSLHHTIGSGANQAAAGNHSHGVTGSVVGTTDTQTLSGKTYASPTVTGTTTGPSWSVDGSGNGSFAAVTAANLLASSLALVDSQMTSWVGSLGSANTAVNFPNVNWPSFTFTAPKSGKVLVVTQFLGSNANGANSSLWIGTTVGAESPATLYTQHARVIGGTPLDQNGIGLRLVTGLTAGNSYTVQPWYLYSAGALSDLRVTQARILIVPLAG